MLMMMMPSAIYSKHTVDVVFHTKKRWTVLYLAVMCRNTWSQGSPPGGELTRPGTSDARTAYSSSVSQPTCQVRIADNFLILFAINLILILD